MQEPFPKQPPGPPPLVSDEELKAAFKQYGSRQAVADHTGLSYSWVCQRLNAISQRERAEKEGKK